MKHLLACLLLLLVAPTFATDVSDNFNVSDGLAGWTNYASTFTENGTELINSTASESLVTHTGTSVGGSDNWACIQVTNIPQFSRWGVVLRSNNTDGIGYVLHMRRQDQKQVDWEYFNGSIFSLIRSGTDSGLAFTVGSNWLCGTVEGQGASTQTRAYEFTSAPASYVDQTTWEGLGSYVQTFSIPIDCTGATCVVAGTYVGVYSFDVDTGVCQYDDFSGGCIDCDVAAGTVGISLTGVSKK